jgi:hypothetical protein
MVRELARVLGRQPWGGQQALMPVPERVLCGAVLPTPEPLHGGGLRCTQDHGHTGAHATAQGVRWYA